MNSILVAEAEKRLGRKFPTKVIKTMPSLGGIRPYPTSAAVRTSFLSRIIRSGFRLSATSLVNKRFWKLTLKQIEILVHSKNKKEKATQLKMLAFLGLSASVDLKLLLPVDEWEKEYENHPFLKPLLLSFSEIAAAARV